MNISKYLFGANWLPHTSNCNIEPNFNTLLAVTATSFLISKWLFGVNWLPHTSNCGIEAKSNIFLAVKTTLSLISKNLSEYIVFPDGSRLALAPTVNASTVVIYCDDILSTGFSTSSLV